MKIAIIGAGSVGRALGSGFAKAGHEVWFGVRDPSKPDALPGPAGRLSEMPEEAEIVILAVPFSAAAEAIFACGGLEGKIVVDATNPLLYDGSGLRLSMGFDTSGAESISAQAPQVRLVKCFNQTGYANMEEPAGSVMFACGHDPDACETVRRLAEEIGFDAYCIGGLDKARLLEPLASLWIHLSMTTGLGRDFALKLEKR